MFIQNGPCKMYYKNPVISIICTVYTYWEIGSKRNRLFEKGRKAGYLTKLANKVYLLPKDLTWYICATPGCPYTTNGSSPTGPGVTASFPSAMTSSVQQYRRPGAPQPTSADDQALIDIIIYIDVAKR